MRNVSRTSASGEATNPMAKQPNILHLITHDTGRHLECYGADVRTPNINGLAEEGVKFTNCFCAAPQCSPSRASMFSGLMPHSNGMMGLAHRGFSLKPDVQYLPQLLARHGYNTFLFGIQHEAQQQDSESADDTNGPGRLGYGKVLRAASNSCADVVPLLDEFLCGGHPEPFFVSAGFSETHRPFPVVGNPPETLRAPPFLPDEEAVRKDLAGINVLVERVDHYVGEVLTTLKRAGLDDNTLVIFTTDHGIAFPGAKATLLDPGIEILLIMRGPCGFEGGRQIGALLSNLDLTPALLEYLGMPILAEMQGISFLPVLRGEVAEVREEVPVELTYHAAYDPMRGIRTRKHKYIRSFEVRPFYLAPNVDDGFSKELSRQRGCFSTLRPFEFLFDLEEDPLERQNLVGSPDAAGVLETFRERLVRWMEQTEDPLLEGPVAVPPGAVITPPWEYGPEVLWFAQRRQ